MARKKKPSPSTLKTQVRHWLARCNMARQAAHAGLKKFRLQVLYKAIGALAIAALSFWVTLKGIEHLGCPSGSRDVAGCGNVVFTRQTKPGELPRLSGVGPYQGRWIEVVGLNVRKGSDKPIGADQFPLELVATPTEGIHRLGIQLSGLPQNQVNSVILWFKPASIGSVTVELAGGKRQQQGAATFDLSKRTLLIASPGVVAPRIAGHTDGWVDISLGLTTSDDILTVLVRLVNVDGAEEYEGDGLKGLTFGGIQANAPQ